MLTKILFSLSVKDQLSIIRVCQHLREHAIGTPGLWTHVDQIQNPAALSFVLERTGNNPVDITNLAVKSPNDPQFGAVAAHMHHIRTLGLQLGPYNYTFTTGSSAFKAFTTTAPMLQSLSFRAHRGVGSKGNPWVSSNFSTSKDTMPRLSSLQLRGVDMTTTMLQQMHSLSTVSFSFGERFIYHGSSLAQNASQHLHNLTTINIELASWIGLQEYLDLGPSVKRVNIRWTKPGLFVPCDAVADGGDWNSIRAIHVKHMCSSSTHPPAVTSYRATFAIPGTDAPYQTLSLRTSGPPDTRVHVRAIDLADRERVFCGLHPTTVAGMVAQIPGRELSTIAMSTTAVALGVFLDARCPALSCVRLVLDTDDIAWINIFARDISHITTLERLEFGQEADPAAKWTTDMIIRTISSCIAAGNKLQEVLFLGFSPGAQCLTIVEMFSQQVVVDQNWRELKNERDWFTKLPFEWH